MEYATDIKIKNIPLKTPEEVPKKDSDMLMKSLASRLAEL